MKRRAHSAGMTLFEVVVAFGIMAAVLLMFLQSQFSMMVVNQMTKYETSGTNVIRRQFEEIMSMAYKKNAKNESGKSADGVPTALIYSLDKLKSAIEAAGVGTTHPVKITLDGGILTYAFLVPDPGWSSVRADEVSEAKNATGVFRIYLRESDVPGGFVKWGDLEADGSITPATNPGFDMDGDGKYTSDFTGLFASGVPLPPGDLKAVPIQAEIKYYRSAIDKNNDWSPVYTVTRNFLINDETLAGS